MTALLLSTVLPYLISRIGGAVVSGVLLKLGAGQAAAQAGSSLISQIASKITRGQQLSGPEQSAWKSHIQANYSQPQPKAVEVSSAPGVPFAQS